MDFLLLTSGIQGVALLKEFAMFSAAAFSVRERKEEPLPPAQIYLQPVAPPSILGLYGVAGAPFMVAAHMAR